MPDLYLQISSLVAEALMSDDTDMLDEETAEFFIDHGITYKEGMEILKNSFVYIVAFNYIGEQSIEFEFPMSKKAKIFDIIFREFESAYDEGKITDLERCRKDVYALDLDNSAIKTPDGALIDIHMKSCYTILKEEYALPSAACWKRKKHY